jgi:hypothetical protein
LLYICIGSILADSIFVSTMNIMAIAVVEFSREGCKFGKVVG